MHCDFEAFDYPTLAEMSWPKSPFCDGPPDVVRVSLQQRAVSQHADQKWPKGKQARHQKCIWSDWMIKSLMHCVRCFFSIVYSVFFFLSVRTSRINPVTQCAEHGFARSEMITTSIGVQAIQNWELSDERCGKSRSNIPVRVAFVRKNKKPNCHRSTYFLLVKPTNFGCWNWCVAWFLLPSCLAQAGKAETVPCQFSAGNK